MFGTLELDKVTLLATANEIITKQNIRKGSLVKKGDILIQLDSAKQLAIVNKAKALIASSTAHLDLLVSGSRNQDIAIAKSELERSKAILVDMKSNYERVFAITKQGAVSQLDKDNATSNYQQAQATNVSAQENLSKITEGNRPQEIA